MNYKDEAVKQWRAYQDAKTEEEAKSQAEYKAERARWLDNDMHMVFGTEVQFDMRYENDEWRAYMTDFPSAYFRHSHIRYSTLDICPIINIPDGAEYTEWWEFGPNKNIPNSIGVSTLREIGEALAIWEKCTWEIHPWPKKTPETPQPSTPQEEQGNPRFAELTLSQANAETRPFRVCATVTIGAEYVPNWLFVVEYTDVELPFPNDLPF